MTSKFKTGYISKICIFFVYLIALLGLNFSNPQLTNAAYQFDMSKNMVIEHLRLSVPREYVNVWRSAEEKTWEPWLENKRGFLGRQLLWDPKNQEATLLISWASREAWKSIPQGEVETIQEKFEQIAEDLIGNGLDQNPFPLTFEGELLPQ
tara:strand:+ start:43177 stop:43629 length:453 start_codon:yes stop_codon:yes gene_type:complete